MFVKQIDPVRLSICSLQRVSKRKHHYNHHQYHFIWFECKQSIVSLMIMMEVVRTKALANRVDGFMLMISQLDASHIIIVRWCDGEWARGEAMQSFTCSSVDASTTETKQKLPNRIPLSCLDFIISADMVVCVVHARSSNTNNMTDPKTSFESSNLSGWLAVAFHALLYERPMSLCRPLSLGKSFTELITMYVVRNRYF